VFSLAQVLVIRILAAYPMRRIPFLSFKTMHGQLRQAMLNKFSEIYDSHQYVLGKAVAAFESEYSSWNGTSHCVGVGNGLQALALSLRTLGIGPGDEVIVPSNTYIASWLAVTQTGASVVPVEPDIRTYNLNPRLIEAAISPRTKAIIPVHLYGQACEMDSIMEIAERNNLHVIEDNAQSQGARYNGRLTGSFGILNATSFYPAKNLGALGDAGAITTDDEALAAHLRVLRNYGSQQKYFNEQIGFNSRLDEIQAGFLRVKLPFLEQWNQERRQIADWYFEELSDLPGLTLPFIAEGATSVFHLFVIRVDDREGLQAHLNAKGIGSLIHYPVPPHLQGAYQDLGFAKGDYPIAEEIAEGCLSLPLFVGLSREEVGYVGKVVADFFGN
jgi:dTDP-4-amino-4,6-dideoxygalactose transaminase